MNRRAPNIFERFIDKAVLLVSFGIALGCLFNYLLHSPNRIQFGGRDLGPDELDSAIWEAADTLQRQAAMTQPSRHESPARAETLRALHDCGLLGDSQEFRRLPPVLPQSVSFGRPIEVPGLDEPPIAPHSMSLSAPNPPDRPIASAGRSMVRSPRLDHAVDPSRPPVNGTIPISASAESDSLAQRELGWITIAAPLDLRRQEREWIAAGCPASRARAHVVRVDVQRQEWPAGDGASPWVDIEPGATAPRAELPEPVFDDATGKLVNFNAVHLAWARIRANQNDLMRPPFYTVVAGDPWQDPHDAAPVLENDPVRAAQIDQTLAEASRGVRMRDFARATDLAQSVLLDKKATRTQQRRAKHLLADIEERQTVVTKPNVDVNSKTDWTKRRLRDPSPVKPPPSDLRRLTDVPVLAPSAPPNVDNDSVAWFHDESAQPGKTYRYRMRVQLWNTSVGRIKDVRQPESARTPLLAGSWSVPSEPVTAPPSTLFFVQGLRSPRAIAGESAVASVEVWKWFEGDWISKTFSASVGERIGGLTKAKPATRADLIEEKPVTPPVARDVDFDTGAVVLDIRDEPVDERMPTGSGAFAYRPTRSVVLVYFDPIENRINERSELQDRADETRKRMKQR